MTFEEIHDKITIGQYSYPPFEFIPLSSSYVIDENQRVFMVADR